MKELEKLIYQLKDDGVSGEFSEQFISRAELAEALELVLQAIKESAPVEAEYEAQYCPACVQMTNHLNGVCQKSAHPPIEAKKELRFLVECAIKGDNIDVVVGQIQALVDKACVAACWQLLNDIEQSLSSHTTPEGKDLLTRSYISNTLEFERMRLRNRPTQLGANVGDTNER